MPDQNVYSQPDWLTHKCPTCNERLILVEATDYWGAPNNKVKCSCGWQGKVSIKTHTVYKLVELKK